MESDTAGRTPTVNLQQFPSHPSCTKCELHQGAKNPGIATVHYGQSLSPSKDVPPLIVIGMNPGVEEDRSNRPFVGPSGLLLRNVYLKHDDILDNTTIYLTNAARCCSLGLNHTPKRSHFRECWEHLEADIQSILNLHTPNAFLLCLGKLSYDTISKQLLGKSRSLKHGFNNQGELATELFRGRINIYTTFHPSAVLRKRNHLYPVSDHINLLGNSILGKTPQVSCPNMEKPRSPYARIQ